MTRIDDALRRAGGALPSALPERSDDVFSPAWHLENQARPSSAERPEPSLDRVPVKDESLSFRFHSQWRERLATSPEANPVLVEQFRRLAATLHHAQAGNNIRVIMLTSAGPNDGKTLSALNLALVLSESYLRRVLLIDADLRRPSLGNVAGLTNAPGLTDALKSRTEQKLAVLRLTPNLTLLPAGRPDPDPIGMLTSARMRNIVEEAKAQFDWVILDAPPVGPIADANLLSEMVDGAIFVIRAGYTQCSIAKKAIDALGRERILGTILNAVEQPPDGHYDYYHADETASLDRSGRM